MSSIISILYQETWKYLLGKKKLVRKTPMLYLEISNSKAAQMSSKRKRGQVIVESHSGDCSAIKPVNGQKVSQNQPLLSLLANIKWKQFQNPDTVIRLCFYDADQ